MSMRTKKILALATEKKDETEKLSKTLRLPYDNVSLPNVNIISDIVVTPEVKVIQENGKERTTCWDSEKNTIPSKDCMLLNYEVNRSSSETTPSKFICDDSTCNVNEIVDGSNSHVTEINCIVDADGFLHATDQFFNKLTCSNNSVDDPNLTSSEDVYQESKIHDSLTPTTAKSPSAILTISCSNTDDPNYVPTEDENQNSETESEVNNISKLCTPRGPDIILSKNSHNIEDPYHFPSEDEHHQVSENQASTSNASKSPSIISSTSCSSINDSNYFPSDDEHKEYEPDIIIPVAASITFHKNSLNPQDVKMTLELGKEAKTDQPNKPKVIENKVQIEQTRNKSYKDRKDYCMYCEQDVSHFARHLFTWHSSEHDIQHILSLASNSKERRDAISNLRKQGNFIHNRVSFKLRPVKRIPSISASQKDDFLPCSHCFGHYKKRYLYRHTKRCSKNVESKNQGKRQTSQSDGHTTLLMGTLLKHDELLKKELFPRMRADKLNMVVKKDFNM